MDDDDYREDNDDYNDDYEDTDEYDDDEYEMRMKIMTMIISMMMMMTTVTMMLRFSPSKQLVPLTPAVARDHENSLRMLQRCPVERKITLKKRK